MPKLKQASSTVLRMLFKCSSPEYSPKTHFSLSSWTIYSFNSIVHLINCTSLHTSAPHKAKHIVRWFRAYHELKPWKLSASPLFRLLIFSRNRTIATHSRFSLFFFWYDQNEAFSQHHFQPKLYCSKHSLHDFFVPPLHHSKIFIPLVIL